MIAKLYLKQSFGILDKQVSYYLAHLHRELQ